MSQLTTLRSIDAEIHAAMLGAGVAGTVTYTPAGGGPAVTGVRVYRDDAVLESFGEVRPVAGTRIELSILRADIANPTRNSTLLLDGITLTLESKIEEDESVSRWVVHV